MRGIRSHFKIRYHATKKEENADSVLLFRIIEI